MGFAIEVDLKLEGAAELINKFLAAERDSPEHAAAALKVVADRVFEESQKIVPYRSGELARSGKVHLPVIGKNTSWIDISYGGGGVDYALTVHETPRAYNDGRSDKYLERPLLEAYKLFKDTMSVIWWRGVSRTFGQGR